MTERNRVTMVGGSASGKSTWLGALANAVERGDTRFVRRGPLPDDTTALDALTERLLQGQYPVQPSASGPMPVELPLEIHGGQFGTRQFVLSTADYPGNITRQLFDVRTGWDERWKQNATAGNIVLFLRPEAPGPIPETTGPEATWNNIFPWHGEAARPQTAPSPSPLHGATHTDFFRRVELDEAETIRTRPVGRPLRPPGALDLIELLQFVRHEADLAPGQRPPLGRIRVAVIVSAWDSLPHAWRKDGPARILGHEYALLNDFLQSNFHDEDIFRFGVSATGGDLKDPAHRRRYMDDIGGYVEFGSPHGLIPTKDLSVPLLWLLEGDRALEMGTSDVRP